MQEYRGYLQKLSGSPDRNFFSPSPTTSPPSGSSSGSKDVMASERTAQIEWPSTRIPVRVKELIDRLFIYLDNRHENADGAQEIFTADAMFVSPRGTARGPAGTYSIFSPLDPRYQEMSKRTL